MTHLSLLAIVLALVVLAARGGRRFVRGDPRRCADVGPVAAGVVFLLVARRVRRQGRCRAAARLAAARSPRSTESCVGADVRGDGQARRVRPRARRLGSARRRPGVVGCGRAGRRRWCRRCSASSRPLIASDLKRLLAYSTTENMGLVFVGVGAAGMFASSGNRAAGRGGARRGDAARGQPRRVQGPAVPRRRVDPDGDRHARSRPPRRARAGACRSPRRPSRSARSRSRHCPPLNGFVSEWLLLQSLVHSLPSNAAVVAVAMPVAVAVVALTGGLAAATFVKAFGDGVPGDATNRRGRPGPRVPRHDADRAGRARGRLRRPRAGTDGARRAAAAGVASLVGGLADGRPIHTNGVTCSCPGSGRPVAVAARGRAGRDDGRRAGRRARGRRSAARVRDVPAWGCGRTVQTARMEYTATSFAEPLQRVFDDVLHPDIDIDVDHHTESRHYVAGDPLPDADPRRVRASPLPAAARRRASLGRRRRERSRTAASTATSPTSSSRSIVVLVVSR